MSKTAGNWNGVGNALVAAVLSGASMPLAKAFSPRVDPVLIAGSDLLASGPGLSEKWSAFSVWTWLNTSTASERLDSARNCRRQ